MVGCTESPGYSSKFCKAHQQQVIEKKLDDTSEPPTKKLKPTKVQTRAEFDRRLQMLMKDLKPGLTYYEICFSMVFYQDNLSLKILWITNRGKIKTISH